METGIGIMAIAPSMWLSGWGSGHGHYQNLSSICHFWSQNDPGGEASLVGADHSPVSGRNGPRVCYLDISPNVYSLSCSLSSKQRSLCLMLHWDMPCWPSQEVLKSKLTYHMVIHPHCHPVSVRLGTCLNLMINFHLVITNQPWEKWHWTQWVRLEQWNLTSKQWRRIQRLKLKRMELIKSKATSKLSTQM